MERSEDPVWENLRRREELRKTQTATGGRKKYVSPLELFRMQLDAEASGGEASTSHALAEAEDNEEAGEGFHQSASRDSDPDSHSSTLPPPSPDDCEADPRLHRKSSLCSDADAGEHIPKGRQSDGQSVVFTKESWLKCMFPFKQCRKAMKSASKSLGLVDMSTTSKDTFFRNPLYNKNKAKATRNNKVPGQVDANAASVSKTNKTKMSKMRSVEHSDGSKKISTAVSCMGSDRRKVGYESARYHGDDEAEVERSDGESFMGEPEFALLVEYYRRPKQFPFGQFPRESSEDVKGSFFREHGHSQSSSPVVKQRSCRSVGTLRKALLRTRHPTDRHRCAIASASPDPSKFPERTADEHGIRRQDSERRDVFVVSHARGKGKRTKKTSSPTIPEGLVSQSSNGKVAGSMAMDLEKSKSNAGSRSRGAEESSDGVGFKAFVPFQGFAAFANQGSVGRADQSAMIQQSFESQCSSASGSRNGSRNNSRNSTHSKNSDRYYLKK